MNIINIKNSEENATLLVKQAFSKIKEQEENIIKFEKSTYYFYAEGAYEDIFYPCNNATSEKKVVFPILNMKNVTIDGGGSEFVFCDRVTPFVLQNSEDICLKNFSIDFSFVRYCIGTVTSAIDSGFGLHINRDLFRYHVDNGNLLFGVGTDFLSTKKRKISVKGIAPKRRVYFFYVGDTECKINLAAPCVLADAEESDEGIFLRYREDSFKVPYELGDLLCLANDNERENCGIFTEFSKQIVFKNISMYRCAGMGIIAQLCTDITIDNFKIAIKENREEFYPTTADAMHFVQCDGKLVIQNSEIHGTYDDAVNVHGIYSNVEEVLSKYKAKICLAHHEQNGVIPFLQGDVVYVTDGKDCYEKGSVAVTDVSFEKDRSNIVVTFAEDISQLIQEGDWLENPNRMPELIFENNIVSNCPRIRISTSQKTVIQNNILNLNDTDIYINDLMGFWHESGAVNDVLITSNQFVSNKNEHSVIITSERKGNNIKKHQNIVIENNTFTHDATKAIHAEVVENLVVRNNQYEIKHREGYIRSILKILAKE